MTSIITGDIINSRAVRTPRRWMEGLKKILSEYGKTPKTWEIYRGDSFQLEVKKPEQSLYAALCIKACIKSVKDLDVRMAIGIGDKTYNAQRITESNGEAFIYSGELFETLKKLKKNLAIKTPWEGVNKECNLMLNLASIAMDKWSVSSAELIMLSLKQKDLSQKELGRKLKISQSSISERQTRAHYDEIKEMEAFFREKIKAQLT